MSGITDVLKVTTIPQRIMLALGGAALLGSVSYNVAQAFEINGLVRDKSSLQTRIDDPKTGFVVSLSQAKTNAVVCQAALATQNTSIRNLSTQSSAKISALQVSYDIERSARMRAERDVGKFLARKPQGATDADRMADVDRQVLEDLK